ncbi:MAG: zinc-ribbon domain-containing protein, partial [Kofleriaceae bacterium]|nr:zinc-ribbon domain-containing protein [Kofleriaceae bacterium]
MKVCPKCGKQYGDDANFCTNDAGRLIAMAASA